MITVQPIPAPSHLLRLIDDRRCSLRADGLPPFTATCVLAPTADDPTIAEVCGLTLAQDGAHFGWHIRALRELLNVGRGCGYRRLVANTDGRLWPGWEAMDAGWIGVDLEQPAAYEAPPSDPSPACPSPTSGAGGGT